MDIPTPLFFTGHGSKNEKNLLLKPGQYVIMNKNVCPTQDSSSRAKIIWGPIFEAQNLTDFMINIVQNFREFGYFGSSTKPSWCLDINLNTSRCGFEPASTVIQGHDVDGLRCGLFTTKNNNNYNQQYFINTEDKKKATCPFNSNKINILNTVERFDYNIKIDSEHTNIILPLAYGDYLLSDYIYYIENTLNIKKFILFCFVCRSDPLEIRERIKIIETKMHLSSGETNNIKKIEAFEHIFLINNNSGNLRERLTVIENALELKDDEKYKIQTDSINPNPISDLYQELEDHNLIETPYQHVDVQAMPLEMIYQPPREKTILEFKDPETLEDIDITKGGNFYKLKYLKYKKKYLNLK